MIKALTLRSFSPKMRWQDCLRESHVAGYNGVELNFDGLFQLDCPLRKLQAIKKTAQRNKIKIASIYSRRQWQTPISSPDKHKREIARRVILRLIDIAETLEAPAVLTIPGAVDNSILSKDFEIVPYDQVYERVLDILTGLSEIARRKGVSLALENVPNKFLLSPLEMRDFIDKTGSPAIGCHFDVANCLYNHGYPEHWIKILGPRIKAIHLKDFRLAAGNITGFVDIFEGDIRWDKVCAALAAINYNGPLIAEVLPAYQYHPEVLIKTISIAMNRIIADIQKYKRIK